MSQRELLYRLIGPYITPAQTIALGWPFVAYERQFAKYEENHWLATGANWEEGNYYDRAMILYTAWKRTGKQKYLDRANAVALDYREKYLKAEGRVTVATWWSMPRGIAAHHLVTGDQESFRVLGAVADQMVNPWHQENNWANLFDPKQHEGREQARVFEAVLLAYFLSAPSVGVPNVQPNGEVWGVGGGNDWRKLADSLLNKTLTSGYQKSNGSRPSFVDGTFNDQPLDKPFMNGLMNEVLVNYYEWVSPDPRILPFVKTNLDYMWTHEWDEGAGAFQYLDNPTTSGEPHGPTADLNMLIVAPFGWVYQQTGDATYKTRGDVIFAGAVKNAWLEGGKQFNQQYRSGFSYPARRRTLLRPTR